MENILHKVNRRFISSLSEEDIHRNNKILESVSRKLQMVHCDL
jgi:hypothetical protein